MFLLKEFIIISAIIISTSLGLFETSKTYLNGSNHSGSQISPDKKVYSSDQNQNLSAEFYYYLNLIQNKSLNREKVQREINSLKSDFEREYLSALLEKREGKFENAFNQLFSLLEDSPKQFYYYEQLATLGKITNNLDKLSKWIVENKDTLDFFKLYLSSLVDNENGHTANSIATYKLLIEQGFSSKEINYQLASAFRAVGNYNEAFHNLIEAERMCDKEDPFIAKIINLKGTLFFLSGDYERAKKEYESAFRFANQTKNTIEDIKALANLAIIKDQYGEVDEAREDFLSAISMAKEIENTELLAFLYSELGVSYTYTNNLVEARKNYQNSYSLYKMLRNNERLSYLSANIGSLFLQISNYKSAIKYYNDGLDNAGENKLGKILNLTGMADVYSNESNYSKALKYYNQAKEIADSIKDIPSILKIDQGIGALYYNINRPLISLEALRKGETLASESKMPFELVKLYSNIGTVLTSIDSIGQAESYFNRGLKIAEQTGDIYSTIQLKTELAYNYYKQNKYSEAEKILNDAHQATQEYELTQVLSMQELYQGKIFAARNEYLKAQNKFNRSFQLSKSANDYNTQIEAGYCLAKSFERTHNLAEAEKWYNLSVNLIERLSFPLTLNQEIQIAHYSGFNEVYNSFTEFYLNQGKDEQAFILLEKSRARNTRLNLDKLKLVSDLKNDDEINNLIDTQWMISSGLYNPYVIDSLNQVYSKIKTELIRNNKGANEILSSGYSINLQDLKQKLDNDEYFLLVYLGEKNVSLFNLNSKGLYSKTLEISRDSLLNLISAISPIYKSGMESEEIYINEDLFSFNAFAAYKLYKYVFQEFLTSIPEKSTLILSFPAELVKLPIEILVTEWNEEESPYYYSDKKYLLNKYQFVYTPSASIYFAQKNKHQENNGQNLLVGNPYVGNTELTLSVRTGLIDINPSKPRSIKLFPLKYSEEEIKSIERTIDDNVILLSGEATESNFKRSAPKSNIVHISSHSFLIKDQPLVMFSPQEDQQDDGFLELGEIVQLGLNSELVVLSSCRSGLGRVDAAEGIIGMQKAFFEAGSKSVVVTLWDVNDKYTSYFMKEFYEQLASGKSKSEALREAKLQFIKDYSANPYYWSAFILSGNPSVIKLQEATSFTVLHVLGILLLIGFVYYIMKKFIPRKHR